MFGVDIVASDLTRAEAPDFAWLEIDPVLLKGKTPPDRRSTRLAGDAATRRERAFPRTGAAARRDPRRLSRRAISAPPGGWPPRRRRWRRRKSRASTRTTTRNVSRSWFISDLRPVVGAAVQIGDQIGAFSPA